MKKIWILTVAVLCLASCGGKGGRTASTDKAGNTTAKFPYPEVPAMIQDHQEQTEFAVIHFWNRYFSDPLQYGDGDVLESAYANFVTMLNKVPVGTALSAQDSLMALAAKAQAANPEGKIFERILGLSSHYLDDPNSPYRNEEFYLPVVDAILASPYSTDDQISKAKYQKPLLSLNRLGTVANDFTYTLKNGRTGTLHGIKAERTLLFFSNPGCENCKEIIDMLSSSDHVSQLLAEGKLAVLNVYPDSDLTEWYSYMSHYPETWINAFDAENILHKDVIYYIKAIPSLYLLDADKRVICKDAPPEMVMSLL